LDADDDGDPDFVTWWGQLRRNQGTGVFSAPEMLPSQLTYPILHADFDRDGDEDLVGSGPSILSNTTRQLARGLPARPGRPASVELRGAPGGSWLLFASAGTGNLSLPPFGTVFLDLATTQLITSGTFSPSGAATVSAITPSTPGIIGLSVYWQALMFETVGPRLTGLEVTTVSAF
jgi:hypothetical protein